MLPSFSCSIIYLELCKRVWWRFLQTSILHKTLNLHLFKIWSLERQLKHILCSLVSVDCGQKFLITVRNIIITFTEPTGIFGFIMNLFVTGGIFISHHLIFVKIWRFMIMFWLKLIFNGEGYCIEKHLKPLLLSGEIEWSFRMFLSFKCDTLYGFPNSFLRVIRAESWNTLLLPTAQTTCLTSSSRRLMNSLWVGDVLIQTHAEILKKMKLCRDFLFI